MNAEVDLRHFLERIVGKSRKGPRIIAHDILCPRGHAGHRVWEKGHTHYGGSSRVLGDWSQLAHARQELIAVGTV